MRLALLLHGRDQLHPALRHAVHVLLALQVQRAPYAPLCTRLLSAPALHPLCRCVRKLWKQQEDLYKALLVCQHEDCRVQMWGCKKVKTDSDPRGHDPNWDPYDVLDTGRFGAKYHEAYYGDPTKTRAKRSCASTSRATTWGASCCGASPPPIQTR